MTGFPHRLLEWGRYTAIPWYTALGFCKGTVTLRIRGRRSGRPIRVSVTTVRHAGSRYIVSLHEKSQWLKNVRAAGGEAVLISRGRLPVHLEEVPGEARAPILVRCTGQRAFSHSGKPSARWFFGLGYEPILEQMRALASRYPVFLIEPLEQELESKPGKGSG